MPEIVRDAPVSEMAGDVSLTIPASTGVPMCLNFRRGFRTVIVSNRDTAVYLRAGLTPRVLAAWFYDASAGAAERWMNLAKDLVPGV